MKRIILPFLFFIGVSASAQTTINESDLPAQGSNFTYYVLDSNATNYENTVGNGSTWDYSAVNGYDGVTNVATTSAASSSSFSSNFPTSDDVFELQGFASIFYSHDASSFTSDGFVFNEAQLGDIIISLENNESLLMNFPTSSSSSDIDDVISGNVYYLGTPYPVTGKTFVSVEGEGTLKLNGNDYINVLRIKIRDSVHAPSLPLIGDIDVERITYEYRLPSESSYPLLQHLSIDISGGLSFNQSVVLAKDDGVSLNVGINDNVQENIELNIYPNPAKENINVVLQSDATGNGTIEIFNTIGQQAKKLNFNASNKIHNIDVSELNKGIYFVRVQLGNQVVTKKITLL